MPKVQKPTKDSPGGPRVQRTCEVCDGEFWPRRVDVERGKGRHCSSNCSSKALRTKVDKICPSCGRAFSSAAIQNATYCGIGCARSPFRRKKACQRCGADLEWKARDRRTLCGRCPAAVSAVAVIDGEPMTLSQLSARFGLSKTQVRNRLKQGRAAGLTDEQSIGSGRTRGPYTPPIEAVCAACGVVFKKRFKKDSPRHFCGRECVAIGNTTSVDRSCEQCGKRFKATAGDVAAGKARFDSKECAWTHAREHPANERKVEVYGVEFSLRELAAASGVSRSAIADRIDRCAMKPERAVLAKLTRGPRPGWRERVAGKVHKTNIG